jgi:hypothetical protein
MEQGKTTSSGAEPAVTTRTMEIVVALVLLLIGAVVAYDSYRSGSGWSDDGPESGYFPFYIGLIIAICSLATLGDAIRATNPEARKSFVDRGPLKQVLSVLVPAALYVFGIQMIGIYVASAVYIAFFMVWLGKYGWLRALIVGVATSVSLFFLFEVWFQVPLPKGSLYDPLSLIGY